MEGLLDWAARLGESGVVFSTSEKMLSDGAVSQTLGPKRSFVISTEVI